MIAAVYYGITDSEFMTACRRIAETTPSAEEFARRIRVAMLGCCVDNPPEAIFCRHCGSRVRGQVVEIDAPDANRLTIRRGVDHTRGSLLPTWYVFDWRGPAVRTAAKLQLARYQDGAGPDSVTAIEVAATVKTIRRTLTVTAPITAAATWTLREAPYRYQLVGRSVRDGSFVALVTGWAFIQPGSG
jgi:ribosomal protein L40E